MSSKYLVANMLSSLSNKRYFFKIPVVVEHSNLCVGILSVMKDYGYVDKFNVVGDKKKNIEVFLTLFNGKRMLTSFKIYSKPSCRVYYRVDELERIAKYDEYSLLIISTSKGVMSASSALENKVGGELLCKVK